MILLPHQPPNAGVPRVHNGALLLHSISYDRRYKRHQSTWLFLASPHPVLSSAPGFSLICLPASLETLSHTLFQELQEFRKLLQQCYFQCLREHSSSSWGGQWRPAHHLGKHPLHHVWPTLKHKRCGPSLPPVDLTPSPLSSLNHWTLSSLGSQKSSLLLSKSDPRVVTLLHLYALPLLLLKLKPHTVQGHYQELWGITEF